jgi:hypothetical protein
MSELQATIKKNVKVLLLKKGWTMGRLAEEASLRRKDGKKYFQPNLTFSKLSQIQHVVEAIGCTYEELFAKE